MRALKLFSLCLTGAALAAISSCGPSAKRAPLDRTVTVTNCKPDQDPVEVIVNDTVQWNFGPSPPTYAIHFTSRTPFSTNDPPIGQKNKVEGDFWCNNFGVGCYYEYVITKDGGKPCADPGVHVGSG